MLSTVTPLTASVLVWRPQGYPKPGRPWVFPQMISGSPGLIAGLCRRICSITPRSSRDGVKGQLLGQHVPRPRIDPRRVGLPPGVDQPSHQLPDQPLAGRRARDDPFQVGDPHPRSGPATASVRRVRQWRPAATRPTGWPPPPPTDRGRSPRTDVRPLNSRHGVPGPSALAHARPSSWGRYIKLN